MLDPSALYELADDLPELRRPVLIQALTGFVDAGAVVRLARDHLLSSGPSRRIATFDADQLLDYRARRPTMLFAQDHWEHYDRPDITLAMLDDSAGNPYLLLSGPEPSLQWERFAAAVATLVERFDVRLTVGLDAIPLAVPHTRPTGVTAHATRRDLVAGYRPWPQRVQVPGSAGNLIEYRLGQRGRDALGLVVHVPHYLAQAEFPAAAEQALSWVARSTGLALALDDLRAAAELISADIDRQIAQAEEASALVQALEQQYDSQLRDRQESESVAAAAAAAETAAQAMPTADELAAELERFLAEQPRPEDPPAA